MKKIILITFLVCFMFVNNSFANTIEVELNYGLLPELKYDPNTIKEIKILSDEYVKTIKERDNFDSVLYYKLNSFIKNNKSSLNSLSALYMIIGMCLLDETDEFYLLNGEKLIDYLINNYSKHIQGKLAIIMKATLLEKREMNLEAIQLLEKNYEVILSIENDSSFQPFLDELNLKEPDNKYMMAWYYYYLANIFSKLKDKNNAVINYNKVINNIHKLILQKKQKKK